MWAGDGRSLFFVSDRSGSENIWRIPTASGRRGSEAAHRRELRKQDAQLDKAVEVLLAELK